MVKSWQDPTFTDSLVKKGHRRPKPAPAAMRVRKQMICTNCLKPVAYKEKQHCRCVIWDVGKRKVES